MSAGSTHFAALVSDPGRRLGLRPTLWVDPPTQRRPTRLDALLQSPPRSLRHRRPATDHQADRPLWTSHL